MLVGTVKFNVFKLNFVDFYHYEMIYSCFVKIIDFIIEITLIHHIICTADSLKVYLLAVNINDFGKVQGVTNWFQIWYTLPEILFEIFEIIKFLKSEIKESWRIISKFLYIYVFIDVKEGTGGWGDFEDLLMICVLFFLLFTCDLVWKM